MSICVSFCRLPTLLVGLWSILTCPHGVQAYAVGIAVWRSPFVGTGGVNQWDRVGEVTRSAFEQGVGIVDAEAIRLESTGIAPHHIFGRNGSRPKFGEPVVARRSQEMVWEKKAIGKPVLQRSYSANLNPAKLCRLTQQS